MFLNDTAIVDKRIQQRPVHGEDTSFQPHGLQSGSSPSGNSVDSGIATAIINDASHETSSPSLSSSVAPVTPSTTAPHLKHPYARVGSVYFALAFMSTSLVDTLRKVPNSQRQVFIHFSPL